MMDPKESARLVRRSRARAAAVTKDLIDGMDRFDELELSDWLERVGDNPRIFDTANAQDHGATGTIAIVGDASSFVFDYVWDGDAKAKRWFSARVMTEQPVPAIQLGLPIGAAS